MWSNFKTKIFKIIIQNSGLGTGCKIAKKFTNETSTLDQVMACCLMATSHYLIHCWPRSMTPYGVISPQWVNVFDPRKVRAVSEGYLAMGLLASLILVIKWSNTTQYYIILLRPNITQYYVSSDKVHHGPDLELWHTQKCDLYHSYVIALLWKKIILYGTMFLIYHESLSHTHKNMIYIMSLLCCGQNHIVWYHVLECHELVCLKRKKWGLSM